MITIWENMDGCAEQFLCATALCLISMLACAYNIILDCGVGALLHRREVVDGLNATYIRFILMLMTTLQLTGEASDAS